MALGPEIARNAPTWGEIFQKQEKATALNHLEGIAKAAEAEFDERISIRRGLYLDYDSIGRSYYHNISPPGLSCDTCVTAAHKVFNYALEELLEILRSRHLPSGWKNLLAGRDQGGGIHIYLVM